MLWFSKTVRTDTGFISGRIETRPNPVGIGSCGTKGGLKGLVDDVSFLISVLIYKFLN